MQMLRLEWPMLYATGGLLVPAIAFCNNKNDAVSLSLLEMKKGEHCDVSSDRKHNSAANI